MQNELPRRRIQEAAVALALLTRLPLPRLPDDAFARQGQSAWAWPLVGLAVSAPAVLLGLLAMWSGLPVTVAALLIVAVQMVLTGAMHEDGLADTADGLWGGWTPERRLEIMKDSRIGTYGVLALVVFTGLRWSLLAALLPLGAGPVLASAVLSRVPMAALMHALPNARGGGLSHKVGPPTIRTVWAGAGIGVAFAVLVVGWPALGASAAVGIAALVLGRIAMARIGGQTGDILGASQQVGEVAAALALLAIM